MPEKAKSSYYFNHSCSLFMTEHILYSWLNTDYLTWKRSCEFAHLSHLQDLWDICLLFLPKSAFLHPPVHSPVHWTAIHEFRLSYPMRPKRRDSQMLQDVFFALSGNVVFSIACHSQVSSSKLNKLSSWLFLFPENTSSVLQTTSDIALLPSADCKLPPPPRRTGKQELHSGALLLRLPPISTDRRWPKANTTHSIFPSVTKHQARCTACWPTVEQWHELANACVGGCVWTKARRKLRWMHSAFNCRWIHPTGAINIILARWGLPGFRELVLPAPYAQQYSLFMGAVQEEPRSLGLLSPLSTLLLRTFTTTPKKQFLSPKRGTVTGHMIHMNGTERCCLLCL